MEKFKTVNPDPTMSKNVSKPHDASSKSKVNKINYITQSLGKGGWRRRVYLRQSGASAGRKDIVLIAPDNTCLRSKGEIERYCKMHKIKLDPEVFSVSASKVEHLFKKEVAMLIRNRVKNDNRPVSVRKSETKAKENDKTHKASSKVAAAQTSAIPIKAKRGRPPKTKTVLSERCRNKSGDSSISSLKRKHSASPIENAKKMKASTSPPNGISGRQTRNSLATSFSPPKSENPTGLVTPANMPSSWKVQKSGDSNQIIVESDKSSISSVRHLKIYAAKHCIRVDLEKFESFFESNACDGEAAANKSDESFATELDKERPADESRSVGTPQPFELSDDEGGDEAVSGIKNGEDNDSVDEEESESLESDFEVMASNIFDSDDYDVPLDDFEMRLQAEEVASREGEPETEAKYEEKEENELETTAEEIKVVNNKDLDKIDPTNFKFFVLPDDDGELPSDSITAADNNPEEISDLEEEEEEEKDDEEDDENDQNGVEEELENSVVPKEVAESAETQDESDEEWNICSPYNLIYESLGFDQWRLLAASLIQPHVSAQVGQALTLNFLERCPEPASLLQLPDPYALPECNVDPKFPWVLGKLLRLARFLTEGTTSENLQELIGSYGVAVLSIFGESKRNVETEEYDLKTYLNWRQKQQKLSQIE